MTDSLLRPERDFLERLASAEGQERLIGFRRGAGQLARHAHKQASDAGRCFLAGLG